MIEVIGRQEVPCESVALETRLEMLRRYCTVQ